MALNLSPEQGVKLTKKDRVHVAKKIKQGWKATCLIPDYGFDENGDIQVMSDRNRRAVKIVKIKDDGIYIEKALKSNPELRQAYESDEVVKNLVDMSMRLEGLPRHTSIHAAGVVIGSKPLDEFVPLSRGADNVITTQFTMTTIEELGLLKMDFLGLRTLTVIQDAARMIGQKLGQDFSIDTIDYDDGKVYEMIGQGKTDVPVWSVGHIQ